MRYCYDCGADAPDRAGDGIPTCPTHGPRWKLVRNAPAADVVLVGPDGRILLGRRAIEPYAGCWELPGGLQDLGEHPAATARREVREELGIDVRLTGLLGFYLDPFEDGFGLVTVFVGETDGEPDAHDDELSTWAWFDPAALPAADEMAWTHRQRLDDWLASGRGPAPSLGLG